MLKLGLGALLSVLGILCVVWVSLHTLPCFFCFLAYAGICQPNARHEYAVPCCAQAITSPRRFREWDRGAARIGAIILAAGWPVSHLMRVETNSACQLNRPTNARPTATYSTTIATPHCHQLLSHHTANTPHPAAGMGGHNSRVGLLLYRVQQLLRANSRSPARRRLEPWQSVTCTQRVSESATLPRWQVGRAYATGIRQSLVRASPVESQ